jgi:hypothetical protein
MLGTFVVCTASWQVLYRFLQRADEKKHALIWEGEDLTDGYAIYEAPKQGE